MSRKLQFVQNEYYHVYNRGCNKEPIFLLEENYHYFIKLLEETTRQFEITVIAYCLMPNHYHFLLRQDSQYSISTAMQSMFNIYTKAFNTYFKRTGTLFEGPFKAKKIAKEGYLLHLCRYIHRNPLDGKLVDSIESWQYSNYLEWVGKREGRLIDHVFVSEYFPDHEDYVEFVTNYTPPEKIGKNLKEYVFD